MPTDYRAISAYNEEMLGKDRASRMSQVSMYADTAHFVFEILQNADDAGATEVVFEVSDDRLVIEHNGNPFTSDDVKAISYFGKGKTDITKIGHFGLGFKSVFAYTASPRIHSGNESFEITDLYTLRAVPLPADLERNRTRFVLPFDHETSRPAYIEAGRLKKGTTARKEIAAKLAKLGPETLLFTRNLAEIRWEADGRPGHYLREERPLAGGGRELFIVTADGDESCFLVFEQPVDTGGSETSPTGRLVQIAYKLSKRLSDEGAISPVVGAKLFVFFQTDKETHTGLIFQAPYRTTPARDNVPEDDDFNRQLVQQSADLLVESVQQLKKLKLLSLEALSALPLDFERFAEGSFFYPVHAAVRDALQRLPLLPTSTGGFVSARQAKMARGAELTKVFDTEQLETLFGIEGVRWLNPALTSARYPALYQLLVGRRRSQPGYFQKAEWASEPLALDMEVSAESMASRLTAGFLKAQSDEWLMRFMSYVAKSSIYAFHSIPIVRLESGEQVVPKGKDGQPNAYLPPQDGSVELNGLPMVKASLLTKQDVVDFLQDDLDLGPPDLADFALTRILPKYRKAEKEVSVARWKKDFRIVVSGLATDSYEKKQRLLDAIRTTAFLIGVLSSNRNDLKLVKPSQLYLSSPEVDEYFAGDETFYITPSDFYEQGDPEALVSMGVARTPRVARRTKDYRGHVSITSWHGWHKRGLDGFDPEWAIEGLAGALQNPTPVRSKLIWRLLLADSSCIRGVVESSTRQSFENPKREEVISATGRLLMETPWILGDGGAFVRPGDIALDELPPGFEKASTEARALAEKLGMKKSEEQEAIAVLARGDARKRKIAEYLMNASDDVMEKFEKLIPKQRELPEFKSFKEGIQSLHRVAVGNPSEGRGGAAPVSNPERYRRTAEDAVREAVTTHWTSPRIVTFSVARDLSSNKLAREFLEQEYQGRCQVTGQTFPKRTGGNYFEALSLVGRLDAEHLNDPGNMLCLCADVAAQFMYAEFAWLDSVEEKILGFKAEKEGGTEEMRKISARVAGKALTITWSERHFLRLCALWSAA
ncbi:MAG: hypothetical protein LC118_21895 [Dehalococcoidia bacterium]|nr:hypothetical protein [Dehalococcoidia bacterium]